MTDENIDETCTCGRPATVKPFNLIRRQCLMCYLVGQYATSPPRPTAGNISDQKIRAWMRAQLQGAIEEMVSLVRADLDAVAKKWNPPPDDSAQDGNQP